MSDLCSKEKVKMTVTLYGLTLGDIFLLKEGSFDMSEQ